MSSKNIRLTRHARRRCKLRDITEEMINQTIYNPDKTDSGYREKYLAYRIFDDRSLKVVYKEEENTLVIITAIWERTGKK